VNSVTQDIPLRVWDEFTYRLDVILAAGGAMLNIYKLYCEYNHIYFNIVFVTSSILEIYTYKIESIFFNHPVLLKRLN
jgi:hypothetical protein